MSLYHQLLNVRENASLEEIRESYRILSKKYHPDINNNDSIQKMALINHAYDTLVRKKKSKQEKADIRQKANGIVKYKDQAYAFYKQGLKLFNLTDLNHGTETLFNRNTRKKLFTDEYYIKEIQRNVFKALYYFNIVCMQYPDSGWYEDSIVKIRILNRCRGILKEWREQ